MRGKGGEEEKGKEERKEGKAGTEEGRKEGRMQSQAGEKDVFASYFRALPPYLKATSKLFPGCLLKVQVSFMNIFFRLFLRYLHLVQIIFTLFPA